MTQNEEKSTRKKTPVWLQLLIVAIAAVGAAFAINYSVNKPMERDAVGGP